MTNVEERRKGKGIATAATGDSRGGGNIVQANVARKHERVCTSTIFNTNKLKKLSKKTFLKKQLIRREKKGKKQRNLIKKQGFSGQRKMQNLANTKTETRVGKQKSPAQVQLTKHFCLFS